LQARQNKAIFLSISPEFKTINKDASHKTAHLQTTQNNPQTPVCKRAIFTSQTIR